MTCSKRIATFFLIYSVFSLPVYAEEIESSADVRWIINRVKEKMHAEGIDKVSYPYPNTAPEQYCRAPIIDDVKKELTYSDMQEIKSLYINTIQDVADKISMWASHLTFTSKEIKLNAKMTLSNATVYDCAMRTKSQLEFSHCVGNHLVEDFSRFSTAEVKSEDIKK